VAMDYIKAHYYASHETINPTRIIPSGPLIDFNTAHGREQFYAEKQSKRA
jgi:putative glutathione S-transferase